jgi:hypothetical protein
MQRAIATLHMSGPVVVRQRPSKPIRTCPLFPQKRTLPDDSSMSALCQKRTHALQQSMRDLGEVLPNLRQ